MSILTAKQRNLGYLCPVESVPPWDAHQQSRVSADRAAWQSLIDDCLAIRQLEDDYDGQGSSAPSQDLVDSAIRLACQLRDHQCRPAHHAVASVNGTIHFEWLDSTRSFDVEVVAPGLAEVCEVQLAGESPPLYLYRW